MSARKVLFWPGLVLLFFAGMTFAQNSQTSKDPDTSEGLSEAEEKKLAEFRAELEIGRNMAGRLITYYGEYNDEALNAYLNLVGNYVAQQGPFADRRYMIRLLNSESVNAFACPGGYILVTMGALRQAENEAELAAILGHESAHVGNRHMMNTLLSMDKKKLEQEANAAADKTEPSAALRMRKRPQVTEQSETFKNIARYLGSSSVAGLSVLAAAKAGISLILEKGLDHKLEFEADQEGVKYAIAAGYDPRAMSAFLGRLVARQKQLNTKTLQKTHPKPADRRLKVDQLLISLKADAIEGAQGVERFKSMQQRLPAASEKSSVVESNVDEKKPRGKSVKQRKAGSPKVD
jgi:predicted Zn-dependent protease